jgi:hypothetical protein
MWNVNLTSTLEDTVFEGSALYKIVRCTKKNLIHVLGISVSLDFTTSLNAIRTSPRVALQCICEKNIALWI